MTPPVTTTVPLARMDHHDEELFAEAMGAIERVASRGAFTGGDEVDAFEREFAAYCGTRHAIGVASGTAALELCLRALGVGPGDEVLVPANTFIATAEAVSLVGATPRMVDLDPQTYLVTPDILADAIGPKTRCLMPVHLYGRTVDMDPIMDLARRNELAVIEDACQAHGAFYKGRRAGSIGDAGCFSFYPAKNLGAWGDGGAVVTSDDEIEDRIRLLRSHGERPRYNHRIVGSTNRLDAIQAAVLRTKLPRLDAGNDERRRNAERLTEMLAGSAVGTPAAAPSGEDHVYHQYVVSTDDREGFRAHLEAHGVASGVHYPFPVHLTGAYSDLGQAEGTLPVAEDLATRIVSLPVFPGLTDEELEQIADAVRSWRPDTTNSDSTGEE
jgi:dTDP-3-amino-3,4,6-trideoxy-alpha-D-glucose transaminase